MAREASKAARILCEALGLHIKERIREKPTLMNAKLLRLDRPSLSSGEVYEIIDTIHGQDLSEDRKRQRQIINRRYKAKKHLDMR